MTIKRPKSKAQARKKASSKFNAELIEVLYLIHSDPDLPTAAVAVALEIARPMTGSGQRSWPSLETITKGCKMGKTCVIRAIQKMVENGHLTAEGGSAGRGHSTRYRFAMVDEKGSAADLLGGEKLAVKGPVADLNKKERKSSKKEAAEGGVLNAVPTCVEHLVSKTPDSDLLVVESREPVFVAEAAANPTILHKRETAFAARMMNHEQHPDFSLDAASPFEMGRGARRNTGPLIDEQGNTIDEVDEIDEAEAPPPKARGPMSYHEAIFGVAS